MKSRTEQRVQRQKIDAVSVSSTVGRHLHKLLNLKRADAHWILCAYLGVSVPSRHETCWYDLRHEATLNNRRHRPDLYVLAIRHRTIRVQHIGCLLSQLYRT